ncbi:MAG: YfhO family protein, partial [Chitinispirillaceae bacterium]|nr:YfhO family protein [Chitinispirillaceae bacterium]
LNTVWHKYTPNYRKATIEVPADGFIRISEVFYPAWEIRIDGKKEKYYRADIAWIALPVKKGKHTVEIIAHSKYFSKFAPISFVIAGLLLLYWSYYLLKNRQRKNK